MVQSDQSAARSAHSKELNPASHGARSTGRVIIPVNNRQQFHQEDIKTCDALPFSRLLFLPSY